MQNETHQGIVVAKTLRKSDDVCLILKPDSSTKLIRPIPEERLFWRGPGFEHIHVGDRVEYISSGKANLRSRYPHRTEDRTCLSVTRLQEAANQDVFPVLAPPDD